MNDKPLYPRNKSIIVLWNFVQNHYQLVLLKQKWIENRARKCYKKKKELRKETRCQTKTHKLKKNKQIAKDKV